MPLEPCGSTSPTPLPYMYPASWPRIRSPVVNFNPSVHSLLLSALVFLSLHSLSSLHPTPFIQYISFPACLSFLFPFLCVFVFLIFVVFSLLSC